MLRIDDEITQPDYWNKIYDGKNDNAKVDASNTKRPANSFDRFSWVAKYAEGPRILGVASGHAHIEKRIRAAHPDWYVVASDQAVQAAKVANYPGPYWFIDAYHLPFASWPAETKVEWNMIIIAQAMEYLKDDRHFLSRACQVAKKIIITVPIGEMEKWSQLRIYTEENMRELVQEFGTIEVFERQGDLLLIKLKFRSDVVD